MKIFDLIHDIFIVSAKADRIRQDEEKRQKSVVFGVSSIIYSVLAAAFVIGGGLLFTVAADSLLIIFLIVIAVALFIGALTAYVGALVRLITQLRLNKRALGWIALAVFILSIAGSAAGLLLILG